MSRDAFGSPSSALSGEYLKLSKKDYSKDKDKSISGDLVAKGEHKRCSNDKYERIKISNILKKGHLHAHELELTPTKPAVTAFDELDVGPPKMLDSPNNKGLGHASHKQHNPVDRDNARKADVERVGREVVAARRLQGEYTSPEYVEGIRQWPADTVAERRSNPHYLEYKKNIAWFKKRWPAPKRLA